MAALKRVALIGGTGMLGSAIVEAIMAREDLFELTIFTRIQSASKLPAGVNSVAVESFDDAPENESFVKSLHGHHVLVSTLNAAVALRLEPKLVAAAIKADVKHFMPSEYTLDVTHPAARELGAGNLIGARAAWADQLSKIASRGQVIYTTLVTGGFLDWGIEKGMLGFDIASRKAQLYDHGENKVTASTLKFVASAVVTTLRMSDEEVKNKRIYVAEVEYTGQELLQALEVGTGEKWSVVDINTVDAVEKSRRLQGEGDARGAYVNSVLALNFNGCGAAHLSSGLQFGQGLDLQRSSLREIVRDIVTRANK